MKYLSLFSGIGGFEIGIFRGWFDGQQNKYFTKIPLPECVGYSEIDKYAIQIYQKHFPKHKNYGDITKINASELPDFDFLVGGFPCQSFSVAGKRGGFNDTRGTLFFEIAKIIRAKQPSYLLLENVKGLLNHDEGRTFGTIVNTLNELGYDVQWQVLNSKNFGVPQNRQRVFIVGHLRGRSRPQIFPFLGNAGENKKPVSLTLGATYGKGINTGSKGGKNSFDKNKRQMVFVVDRSYPSRERVYKDFTPTLRDFGSGGNKMPLVNGIRRLTPKECERLQGFPDNWTEGISDTQRYKTLGNAVTTNVITSIMEKLYVEIGRQS